MQVPNFDLHAKNGPEMVDFRGDYGVLAVFPEDQTQPSYKNLR